MIYPKLSRITWNRSGKQTRKRTLYLPDQVTETPVQPDGQDSSTIIVDNTEAETEGVWIRDTTANDYYYDNYVYAKSTTGTATSKMRWRPELPESVTYSVYYKIPQITATSENWATNASFTVYYSGGSETVTVDETTANGTWVHLGDYPFAAGDSGYVELTNKANKSQGSCRCDHVGGPKQDTAIGVCCDPVRSERAADDSNRTTERNRLFG